MRLGDAEAPAGLPPAREPPAEDAARSFPSVCLRAALAGLAECV